jgi:predicted DsbA family dithiol-disulfide isomerase
LALACVASLAQAEPIPSNRARDVVYVPRSALPIRGPRFARVTLDVYLGVGDRWAAPQEVLARRAVERDPDVREVLHVTLLGSTIAPLGAEALLAAEAQGAFWPYLDRLTAANAEVGQAELTQAARDVGLDVPRFSAELNAHTYRAEAVGRTRGQGIYRLLSKVAVNGHRMPLNFDEAALKESIAQARERADEALRQGVPLSGLYEAVTDGIGALDVAPARVHASLVEVPLRGAESAPVTVVIFGDLTSLMPLAECVRHLETRRLGQVRVGFRHFVPAGAGDGARLAAELGAAAAAQGRFWTFFDLMTAGPPGATLDEPSVWAIGARAGLDVQRARREQADGTLGRRLERDRAEARRLKVTVSPSLVVNGRLVSLALPRTGQLSERELDWLVQSELNTGVLERLR